MAACLIGNSILTRAITTVSDEAAHHLARLLPNVLCNAQHCLQPDIRPRKELNMKANVYHEEGRASHLPQLNAAGKPTPPQTRVPPKAGSAKWRIAAMLLLSAIPLAAGAFRL